ncbi:hypothetical protein GA0074692_1326 [Micromonospora pallida]|uniref:Uncharacterized protein n=1 Tax=Micromonospora pallida TaxID=145854 RepID=A0A1C6RY14_9ACTN|nr:hypothetical protein [Micromonospora pallida]SCL22093.1 hypothetical protein GA0074692_1326 [Micromonospora pallida]
MTGSRGDDGPKEAKCPHHYDADLCYLCQQERDGASADRQPPQDRPAPGR